MAHFTDVVKGKKKEKINIEKGNIENNNNVSCNSDVRKMQRKPTRLSVPYVVQGVRVYEWA